jgi:DNA-binding NarL/FixJ family response regulator
MLKILIVEDEPLLATTLKYLIELNPRFQVTQIADDLDSALAAVAERLPDLALVDLQLAHGSTGFTVAVKLNELGVACLFTTGKAPPFAMPDLALGCLTKPYTEEDVVRALKTAEDKLRGREPLRPSLPENLEIYAAETAEEAPATEEHVFLEPVVPIDSRRSIRTRLTRWLLAS